MIGMRGSRGGEVGVIVGVGVGCVGVAGVGDGVGVVGRGVGDRTMDVDFIFTHKFFNCRVIPKQHSNLLCPVQPNTRLNTNTKHEIEDKERCVDVVIFAGEMGGM